MGNWLCPCTNTKDSACSLPQENSTSLTQEKGRRRKKKGKPKNRTCKSKNSTKNEKLSVTSIESARSAGVKCQGSSSQGISSTADLTVVGHAFPILQQCTTPLMEANAKAIVVQPSCTSEHSSEETFPGRRLKRPITGSDSNTSLRSQAGVEESQSNGEAAVPRRNETRSFVSSSRQESHDRESPERSSQFQLLELLKIRLDMAANNMEINRLMANVERALDRTSRARQLGFRRILAARASRRVQPVVEAQEKTAAYGEEDATDEEVSIADGEGTGADGGESFIAGDETGTDGEEYEEETEGDGYSNDESETPPPPPPRICWQ